MRKSITSLVAALAIICTFQFFSIPAAASSARWPKYARNVTFGTDFYDTGEYSDPYSMMDIGYVDVFRFQVPESGSVTINLKAESDAVPFLELYKTSDTEERLWFGFDITRDSYDYDYDEDGYWSEWQVELEKGNYYLYVVYDSDDMEIPFTYNIDYTTN